MYKKLHINFISPRSIIPSLSNNISTEIDINSTRSNMSSKNDPKKIIDDDGLSRKDTKNSSSKDSKKLIH